MAISPESGVLYYELHIGTVNMAKFNHFMYNVSLNFQDVKITFVMDNATIHNQAQDCVEVINF